MDEEPTGGRQLPLFPPPGAPRRAPEPLAPAPVVAAATSLAAAAGAFDDHLARIGKTDHTRRAFASDLRLAMRHLGRGRRVEEVTADDLRRFLSWMLTYRDVPCRPKTYARRVTTLKVFFAWLKESGALEADPAAGLLHRRAEAPLPRVLTDREVDSLLAAAEARSAGPAADPRPELLVRLLLATGLKKGEVARLRLLDLGLDGPEPSLLVRYDEPRWRDKERRLPIDSWLVPLVRRYLDRYAPSERLFECTDRNLEYVLRDVMADAGLADGAGFETMRWTSALRSWREGVPPDVLRARLGLAPISWAETERRLSLLAAAPR